MKAKSARSWSSDAAAGRRDDRAALEVMQVFRSILTMHRDLGQYGPGYFEIGNCLTLNGPSRRVNSRPDHPDRPSSRRRAHRMDPVVEASRHRSLRSGDPGARSGETGGAVNSR